MLKTTNRDTPVSTPVRSKPRSKTGNKEVASSPGPRSAPVPNTRVAQSRAARAASPAPILNVSAKATVTQARKRRGAAAALPGQIALPATSSVSTDSPSSASTVALPDRTPGPIAGSKQEQVLSMLRRRQGASVAELMQTTGWMSHSVRGLLSAVVKRKLGLDLDSTVEQERGRVYRVPGENSAPVTAPASLVVSRRKASRAGGRSATATAGTAG